MHCTYFLPSIAFDVHTFSDIPEVNPHESSRIICNTLHGDLLFFVSDIEVGAAFFQYLSTKALLRYWLCRMGQGLLKFSVYVGVGTFEIT